MNEQPEQKLPEVPSIQPVGQSEVELQSVEQPSSGVSLPTPSNVQASDQLLDQELPTTSPEMASAEKPVVDGVLEWSAPEYIQKPKSPLWFVGLGAVALVLVLIDIFFMKVYTFSALVIVMSLAVVVWSKRPARLVQYHLDESAIVINGKNFPLRDFKSFGVVQKDNDYSITMIPNKRFSPSVNIHFPEELGEYIVDTLGVFLPMEKIELDFIDKLMHKLNI